MSLHFATAWETVCDTVPEVDAVVMGSRRLSYRDFDSAAARLASAIEGAGVRPGAKVSMYLYNCPEYLIAQFGAVKQGCSPINVNYRYLDEELVYLVDNSDTEVLVFHTSLADRVDRVRDRLTGVKLFVSVDDGQPSTGRVDVSDAVDFDVLLETHEPQARRVQDPADLYMLYTGGTTGMPKGVMYEQGAFLARSYATHAAADQSLIAPTSPAELADFVRAAAKIERIISVPCCPLMHGTGMWVGAMPALFTGGTVVLLEERSFDATELLDVIERERATRPVIVGDAFARPLARAMDEAATAGRLPDLSSVVSVISSGAMWSQEVKRSMSRHMPSAVLIDALGSTEGGSYGRVDSNGDRSSPTALFQLLPSTLLVDESGETLERTAGTTGLLASETPARGYYKDPVKSERTFRKIGDNWYVITGDWASIGEDGSITLHGRGSNCINSGGEKIFPEEVEEAIKTHEGVDDCYVVGIPDERFGQRVVAVAATATTQPDEVTPSGEQLRAHLRDRISGYKIPRQIIVVPQLQRAPNGKADYGWAREIVEAHAAEPTTA